MTDLPDVTVTCSMIADKVVVVVVVAAAAEAEMTALVAKTEMSSQSKPGKGKATVPHPRSVSPLQILHTSFPSSSEEDA